MPRATLTSEFAPEEHDQFDGAGEIQAQHTNEDAGGSATARIFCDSEFICRGRLQGIFLNK